MLGVKRQSQMDRMRTAVRDAVAYVDEVAGDERLRADLRAAIGHGAEARDQIRKDVAAGNAATRLANDRKLRKKVRAMLDDLDSASGRVRRRSSHRLRNGLLILGGVGVLAAAIPNLRRWFTGRAPEPDAGTIV
jgi:hypothetical protein